MVCVLNAQLVLLIALITTTVHPVTNDQPLGPENAVFSGRWSLVRGLQRKTIIVDMRLVMPGEVVCSTRLVASHGGL